MLVSSDDMSIGSESAASAAANEGAWRVWTAGADGSMRVVTAGSVRFGFELTKEA